MAGAGHCGIDNHRLRPFGWLGPCPFEADGPAAIDHDIQQTAHHGDVLHEMDHLILGLGGRHRPEVVEEQGGQGGEHHQHRRGPAGLEAGDQHGAAGQLDDDGADGGQLRQWKALAGDVAYRALEAGDLAVAGKQEDERDQKAPDHRAITFNILHIRSPFAVFSDCYWMPIQAGGDGGVVADSPWSGASSTGWA